MRYLAIVLLFLTACGGAPDAAGGGQSTDTLIAVEPISTPTETASCATIASGFTSEITSVLDRWSDANELAGSTARGSLAPQIQELQEIRRNARDLEAPECAKLLQDLLVSSMDHTIKSYLDFMSMAADDVVQNSMRSAASDLDEFTTELARIRGGGSVAAAPTRTAIPTLQPASSFPIDQALTSAGDVASGIKGGTVERVQTEDGAAMVVRRYTGKDTLTVAVTVYERADDAIDKFNDYRSDAIDDGIGSDSTVQAWPLQVGEGGYSREPKSYKTTIGYVSAAFVRCHAYVLLESSSVTAKVTIKELTPFLERLDKELQDVACR